MDVCRAVPVGGVRKVRERKRGVGVGEGEGWEVERCG